MGLWDRVIRDVRHFFGRTYVLLVLVYVVDVPPPPPPSSLSYLTSLHLFLPAPLNLDCDEYESCLETDKSCMQHMYYVCRAAGFHTVWCSPLCQVSDFACNDCTYLSLSHSLPLSPGPCKVCGTCYDILKPPFGSIFKKEKSVPAGCVIVHTHHLTGR